MSSPNSELEIQHTDAATGGEFFIERDGVRLAELSYTRAGAQRVIIDHTQVEQALRGQGVARTLLDRAVAWARETNTRVIPSCSYAKAQFDRDASIRDVLSG
jgi:predicted GNAT family acetyltransferase